jgi:glycosyltransferase involved in cell wall biosynthesis
MAPINIGVTAGIETTKVSPVWLEKANIMDKIITVSTFSKEVFTNTVYQGTLKETGAPAELRCKVPIEVVHYPVKQFKTTKLQLDMSTKFNFLSVAQWGPRKNMQALLDWFVEEFIDNSEVGLVVKTFAKGGSILDKHAAEITLKRALVKYPNRKCKIYLLHGDLSEEEMHSLYVHPKIKAFVSLSHGEGYGLPHFEAAYSGLPVIAPQWSGYLDFLCMPKRNKKGREKIKPCFATVDYTLQPVQPEARWKGVIEEDAHWCFASQGSFKMRLREIYKDHGRFKKQAQVLKQWIWANFTAEKKYNDFNNTLMTINIPVKEINGISFCIPTNGKRKEKTLLTISSMLKQEGCPFEIIICGDVENFRDIKNVVLVDKKEEAHSRMVAALRNRAAETAQYENIVFCDDDIILDSQWLHNTLEYSKTHGWDILGNRVFSPDGTRYWDRATLSPHVLVDYDFPPYSRNIYQSSAYFMVRKHVFDKVQWDETKLVYADKIEGKIPEDVQYSHDLLSSGFNFSFNETALVWHNDDSYTEFSLGERNLTLKKDTLREQHNMNFFLQEDSEFEDLVEKLTNGSTSLDNCSSL